MLCEGSGWILYHKPSAGMKTGLKLHACKGSTSILKRKMQKEVIFLVMVCM